jgi:hypothetical protein
MAKHSRRRKAKGTTRRRRRIGATASMLNPSSKLVQYGSIALGYIMGDKINDQLAKIIPASVDAKLVAAGQAGLGAMLAFSKGKKSLLKTVGGGVLLGAGIKQGMAAFGMGSMGGYRSVPVLGGYNRVPVIGASRVGSYNTNPNGLNGYTVSPKNVSGAASLMDDSRL